MLTGFDLEAFFTAGGASSGTGFRVVPIRDGGAVAFFMVKERFSLLQTPTLRSANQTRKRSSGVSFAKLAGTQRLSPHAVWWVWVFSNRNSKKQTLRPEW